MMTIDATISSPTNLIWVEGSPATCTADGIAALWKCPRCGGLFTDEEGLLDTTLSAVTISKLGHDLEKVPAKAPTCTADGNIEYYRCVRDGCGRLFSDANGTNELTTDVVLPAQHDIEKVPAKAPTYDQDGNIEHYRCKRCDALFSDANETQELTANDVVLAKLVRTDDLPQTGDSSRLTGWLALLGACCAGIWCLNRRRG